MCKPGEPCPGFDEIDKSEGMSLFESLNDMRVDPHGMEYVVVAETMTDGRFGTSIQGESETVTKMIGSILRTFIEAYSKEELLMLVAAVIALQIKNNPENEHDPALFQQIQKK